jgi:hypothetical protein
MLYSNPDPTGASIETALGRLTAARSRGLDWLVEHVDARGKPAGADEINYWYRLPWALAMSGRLEEAGRVMSWIEHEALLDGNLRAGSHQIPWTVEAATYPLAIIAIGAWHLERFGTANQLLDTLVSYYQDPDTGGAYVERPEHRQARRQDLLCTAQLGLAALTAGRMDVAERTFKWIERLWAAQPALPERLFLCWGPGGLITEFAEAESFGRVVVFDKGRQAFFNPGIGAAFLSRYQLATGNEHAREIGRRLLELSAGGTSLQYDFPDTIHVGKFAWGAAAMLSVDPSDAHLVDVLSMADWCADSQLSDGSWDPSHFLFPDPQAPDKLWKTAEHVMIINFMLDGLGTALATRQASGASVLAAADR